MRWFLQNLQIFLPILLILATGLGQVVKALMEQRQELRNRRSGSAGGAPGGVDSEIETVPARSPSPHVRAREQELEAQRRAQIEMWRAREAMMRGQSGRPAAAPRTAEEELALRRRLAMEELRRREAATRAEQMRQAPSADRSTSGRESRRQRAQRGAPRSRPSPAAPMEESLPAPAPAAAREQSAALPEGLAQRRGAALRGPAVVPTSRASGLGSILLTRGALRQALVLKELLDPPLAIRDTPGGLSDGYHQPF